MTYEMHLHRNGVYRLCFLTLLHHEQSPDSANVTYDYMYKK